MTSQSTPPAGTGDTSLLTANGNDVADARRISSHEILSGDREVIVEHRGSDYRLRLTANGKLILTK